MKVAFYTLGCKVNQYETESMTEQFLADGFEVVSFSSVADVYVINTCTVTAESDRKSRQALHRAKANNPSALLAVCGCYVQNAGADSSAFSEADVVVGNRDKTKLLSMVKKALADKMRITLSLDNRKYLPYAKDFVSGHLGKTRAVLKIEDGCDNFCSYCAIPFARGRVCSKPFDNCVKEFSGLVEAGMKEIVVTGIEIASYGQDTGESLLSLLQAFDSICGKKQVRIRLGSLEPRLITEDFCKGLSSLSHICPHFHLSMQSGCDETLKRMNRKYTAARFKESAVLLRKYLPSVMLTTDLIVGFPGETDEEWQNTVSFLKDIRFLKVHIFPYSNRRGTVASRMPNQVLPEVKAERAKEAFLLCENIRNEILQSLLGTKQEVLLETCKNGMLSGFTPNYIPVTVEGTSSLENTLVFATFSAVTRDGVLGNL